MKINLCIILGMILLVSNLCFAQQWQYETVKSNVVGAWILSGDFDNDNIPDLLVQNGDTLLWFENMNPGWTEHLIETQFFGSEFASLGIFDMDNDGDLDILQTTINDTGVIAWNENKLNGMQWEKHVIAENIPYAGNQDGSNGDLDGDLDIDVIMVTWDEGKILWFENAGGDTTWNTHEIAEIGVGGIWSTVADMDGDTDLDIIAGSYFSGNIVWYENILPDTNWTAHPVATLPGDAIGICADIDEDGLNDIITHSNSTDVLIWFKNPTWAADTIASGISEIILGFEPMADIDQDGDIDITFGGANDIGWCERLGSASNWQTHIIGTDPNEYPFPSGTADIDLDGYPDIMAYTIFNFTTFTGDTRWYVNPANFTGLINGSHIPTRVELLQNYPNPFNPSTTIEFSIPKSEFVTLKIYNLLGQEIASLVSENLKAGNYNYLWDASSLASGVYIYKIEAGDFIKTKKLILMK